MRSKQAKPAILLVVFLVLSFLCMLGANSVQTASGTIRVSSGVIDSDVGELSYKLYTPQSVSAENKAPGVLLLHGYQNDHETCAAYAIELARRGAVVLAIDEYGHGKTVPGLMERGFVNKKVAVNFGEESEEDGTFQTIGGTVRYRILMNFSNLSFFNDIYTKDDAGNSIKNSAEGGIEAYAFLAAMPEVDATRLGISGHSMGTWASWSVAAAYAGAKDAEGNEITPKATVLQCGELFRDTVYDAANIYFNNVLLLQAKYDEFSYFRDYENTVSDALLETPLRTEFLGTDAANAKWNTTYGSMADGSARRMELLYTNHRLTTHDADGLKAALDWFQEALSMETSLSSSDQIAMRKEWLNLLALFFTLLASLALMVLLLDLPFFSSLKQPLPPEEGMLTGRKWRISAWIAILIPGVLYPFATQLGHALVPYPDTVFRMTVGDGLMTWYLFVLLINIPMLVVQMKKAKKNGLPDSLYTRGLSSPGKKGGIDFALAGKGLLLAFCMMALVYLFVIIYDALFLLDLRIIWPMFAPFNAMRFGQFFLYLPVFALYFLLANAKALGALRTKATYQEGVKGFLLTWIRCALVMCGGILLIVAIEYIPFFAGIGPGADLLFSPTFGGPFMSLMILLLPQIVVYSLIGTFIYRKCGNVYVGGFFTGILACWIVTGGSSFL